MGECSDWANKDAMEHLILGLAGLAALGLVAGFMSGLLGIGGGIILVPGLVAFSQYMYAGQIDPDVIMHTALGTSLAIIIPTGLSSARAQIKRKAVDWAAIKKLGPGLVAGVALGVIIAAKLDGAVLQSIFAVGLYGMAALIAKQPKPHQVYPVLLKYPYCTVAPAGVGLLATLMGLGGAIMNIPYLTFAGVPLHRAIASGSVLGVMVALPATIGFFLIGTAEADLPPEFFGFINMKAWAMIVPFSIIMAPVGVKTSHKIDAPLLRKIFAGFIFIVATKMLWDVVSAYL